MAERRIAFVPPRYGPDVIGGSEAVIREAAGGLAGRGWAVEVLTTCARDHYTWRNELPAGATREGPITIRRFPVAPPAPDALRRGLEARIQAGEPLAMDEQLEWLNAHLRVPELYHHLVTAGSRYDAVVFSPYLFWTTVVGLSAVPGRSVVMPCLHDEAVARLDVVRPALAAPVAVWFLSEPEHELAHRLGAVAERHAVVGAGVDPPEGYDPEGFCARHRLDRPFVLYAGRREAGKGWEWLLHAFEFALSGAGAGPDLPLDLVSIGVGGVRVPPALAGRVHDLGLVSDAERNDAFAAAAAYIQPSPNESFSRTVMEAWLAGTLVIASAGSEVVAWHCRRSGAGLLFSDEFELVSCLAFVAEAPKAAAALAEPGRDYVRSEYGWSRVLDRMEASLREVVGR